VVDLQELIARGRLVMSSAPGRLDVFQNVNGKRNTKEIAKELNRHVNNVSRDLTVLTNAGLIRIREQNGKFVYKDKSPVYEKEPLARTLKPRYFQGPSSIKREASKTPSSKKVGKSRQVARRQSLKVPNDVELLAILEEGEEQLYEFKQAGTKIEKLAKEISGMLNTREGGIIFYGVSDDGKPEGSDLTAQDLDQRIQNGIRTTIRPRATVRVKRIKVIGVDVLAIVVPPWNRKEAYQLNENFFIRHGSNVFPMTGAEIKDLSSGRYVV
jgi:predicted HTH transcriptional regulator